jgi:hypothetical protein
MLVTELKSQIEIAEVKHVLPKFLREYEQQ